MEKKGNAYKHGLSEDRFRNIFYKLQSRCSHSSNNEFRRYGGRGIRCSWRSFDEFIGDMHQSYKKHVAEFGEKNTQIDRINPNGHYSRENCRWATCKEQQQNRRNSIFVEYMGDRLCLSDWSRKLHIGHGTLHGRLFVYGWSIEDAFTTPVAIR